MDRTFFWCIVGFIFFNVAVALRMYTVIRVKGLGGYLSKQTGVADAFSKLVAERLAPAWIQPLMWSSGIFGLAVIFGSILFISPAN